MLWGTGLSCPLPPHTGHLPLAAYSHLAALPSATDKIAAFFTEQAIPQLVQLLQSNKVEVQICAAGALGKLAQFGRSQPGPRGAKGEEREGGIVGGRDGTE